VVADRMVQRPCIRKSARVHEIRSGRSPLAGALSLLIAFALAASFALVAPVSRTAAASPTKFCVDNYKTKKVTCAATKEEAEALNGVSSTNVQAALADDYISFVLWNDYNYTGSGYFLWDYPCSGGWNNLIDWQDQTRSAQPIECGEITLYGAFNLYTNPNGPTYCYTYGGNVYPLGGGTGGYGKSFQMGDPPSLHPYPPYCG
jgi:hypothetical protein